MVRSAFLENEVREMTPKNLSELSESYVEYYQLVPSLDSACFEKIDIKKDAFNCFFVYAANFAFGFSGNEANMRTLKDVIARLQKSQNPYGKKTLAYLKEMDEIEQKAKAHPRDVRATEDYEFLKSKLDYFVRLAVPHNGEIRGSSFFREVTIFDETGRPTYAVDINPIIDALLHKDFDLREGKGQKIVETWLSIGAIQAVQERYKLNRTLEREN